MRRLPASNWAFYCRIADPEIRTTLNRRSARLALSSQEVAPWSSNTPSRVLHTRPLPLSMTSGAGVPEGATPVGGELLCATLLLDGTLVEIPDKPQPPAENHAHLPANRLLGQNEASHVA